MTGSLRRVTDAFWSGAGAGACWSFFLVLGWSDTWETMMLGATLFGGWQTVWEYWNND